MQCEIIHDINCVKCNNSEYVLSDIAVPFC